MPHRSARRYKKKRKGHLEFKDDHSEGHQLADKENSIAPGQLLQARRSDQKHLPHEGCDNGDAEAADSGYTCAPEHPVGARTLRRVRHLVRQHDESADAKGPERQERVTNFDIP